MSENIVNVTIPISNTGSDDTDSDWIGLTEKSDHGSRTPVWDDCWPGLVCEEVDVLEGQADWNQKAGCHDESVSEGIGGVSGCGQPFLLQIWNLENLLNPVKNIETEII